MTKVIVFNDNSVKYKYLLQYLKEEGYEADVKDVNVASSLEERFETISPEGSKVFLPFSNEDLVKDNERLRQVIQGLESNGWRNLIVLPFEGMTDKSIEDRVKTELQVVGDNPEGRETVLYDRSVLNKDVVEKDNDVRLGEFPIKNVVTKDEVGVPLNNKGEVKEDYKDENVTKGRKVRDLSKK